MNESMTVEELIEILQDIAVEHGPDTMIVLGLDKSDHVAGEYVSLQAEPAGAENILILEENFA